MTQWSEATHSRIAAAIKAARGKQRSAQWLADRTGELGYPITRAQIANYESGRKQSLDIAELVVIAAALDLSPAQLIFPGLVDGLVEVLPDRTITSASALEWFSGMGPPLPWEVVPPVDADEADAVNAAWRRGAFVVGFAMRVKDRRERLYALTHHPAYRDQPDRQIIFDAVDDLEIAKEEARHLGLVVEDKFDRKAGDDA